MKKIKYLTPILGLTAMMGVAAPIATSCSKQTVSTVLPVNTMIIDGVTLKGLYAGTDLSAYDTIEIPEGVEIISDDAFNQVKSDTNAEDEGFDYSPIKTLKLPSTLRQVGSNSFAGLTSLTSIDLSSWDQDTIEYIKYTQLTVNRELEEPILTYPSFGLFNRYGYCYVQLPESIQTQVLEKAKSDLEDAGIPDFWFIKQSTGHVEASSECVKETTALAQNEDVEANSDPLYGWFESGISVDKPILKLTDPIDTDKYTIEIYPQRTASSDAYDFARAYSDEIVFDDDNKTFTFPTYFDNVWNETFYFDITSEEYYKYWYYIRKWACDIDGHTCDYNINVICRKNSTNEIIWNEAVSGFKLTYDFVQIDGIKIKGMEDVNTYTLSPYPAGYWECNYYDEPTTVAARALMNYFPLPSNIEISPSNAVYNNTDLNVWWSTDNKDLIWLIYDQEQKTTKVSSWIYDYMGVEDLGTASVTVTPYTPDAYNKVSDSAKYTFDTIACVWADGEKYDTVDTAGTYFSANYEGDRATKPIGYTLQPGQKVTFTMTITEDKELCNVQDPTNAYRMAGVMHQVKSPTTGEYNNEPIEFKEKGVTITRTRTVSGKTQTITLDPINDYTIALNKEIVFNEDDSNENIQFQQGDILTFTFDLANTDEVKYAGFYFWINKIA